MSDIVADFIVSVRHRAAGLTVTDAAAVSAAFGHLVRAMVRMTPATFEAARAPISGAQFERARRHILRHLASPALSADTICKAIGVSRRQLYYLFERHGGVAAYIRERRLAACHEALARRPVGELVSTIAYAHGFTNAASFSRQFRDHYGCSPNEVGSAGTSTRKGPDTFIDWLLRTDSG